MANGSIIFDLRCLQDERYRDRGVGRLGTNLLRSARQFLDHPGQFRIIGIVDPALPTLEQRFTDYLDETRVNGYLPNLNGPAWFVQLSPMTHDPLFVGRILDCTRTFKASIIHDFIPLRDPQRYLPTLGQKIDYQNKLRWLARHDHFFPNSNHTKSEVMRVLGVPESRITVSSAPIDPVFVRPDITPHAASSPYILAVGGGDARKNIECAIRAHAKSQLAREQNVRLLINGRYPASWQHSLRALHDSEGGAPHLLFFLDYVPDEEFVVLYKNSLCTVVPSKAEGFSIPTVEGMAAGAPVLVSAIPVHEELVENPDYMFAPEDDERLAKLIDRVIVDADFRNEVVADQSQRWQRFQADTVAGLFWANMEKQARALPGAPMIGGRRPAVAVLGPLPPDRSGVADYTAAMFKELGKHVDIHVFTETKSPNTPEGVVSIAPMTVLPCLTSRLDRVIGVMGNSHFHLEVYKRLTRYGGACIQHDNRLLGFYRILIGERQSRELAEQELRRTLEPNELDRWLADESTLEATFLGEVAQLSDPLFVHSRGTARLVRERFDTEPKYLPFSIYREWDENQLTPANREYARRRLGIASDEVAIITLGYVSPAKAPLDCIWALELLRGWNIPAKLYFVGQPATDMAPLARLCDELDLSSQVRFLSDYVSEDDYRDYLLAADVAVQLRTHLLGGLSGALLDCIVVGLPTVANQDLVESMEAPSYVFPVPDRPSPVLIAEALASAIESRATARTWQQEQRAYREVHNFREYAIRLCAGLSLDTSYTAAG